MTLATRDLWSRPAPVAAHRHSCAAYSVPLCRFQSLKKNSERIYQWIRKEGPTPTLEEASETEEHMSIIDVDGLGVADQAWDGANQRQSAMRLRPSPCRQRDYAENKSRKQDLLWHEPMYLSHHTHSLPERTAKSFMQRHRLRQRLQKLLGEAVVVHLFGPRLRSAARHRAATLRAVRIDGLAGRSHSIAPAGCCFVVEAPPNALSRQNAMRHLLCDEAPNLHASQLISKSESTELRFRCHTSGEVVTVCRKQIDTLQRTFPLISETGVAEALLSAGCHLGWARLLLHRRMNSVAAIQKLWRGRSVRKTLCVHGSERLVELHRDPERAHKLDVAARRKQDRAAIRIVAVLKGHMVRSRLRGDCDGADAFADPGRHERIQKARFSKTARRTRVTGPPNTIEDLAAALIASIMKGHLVRRRIREGHVARFVDPNRDRLIGAARALRRSGYTPRTMATVGAHTDWTVRAHTQSTSGLHNDEWLVWM